MLFMENWAHMSYFSLCALPMFNHIKFKEILFWSPSLIKMYFPPAKFSLRCYLKVNWRDIPNAFFRHYFQNLNFRDPFMRIIAKYKDCNV